MHKHDKSWGRSAVVSLEAADDDEEGISIPQESPTTHMGVHPKGGRNKGEMVENRHQYELAIIAAIYKIAGHFSRD